MKVDLAHTPSRARALCVELPETGYRDAMEFQRSIVSARASGALHRDTFIFLEHTPVFTLGRRGGEEFITVPREMLRRSGIPVICTDRGGTVTYHGPGQIVMYPIVSLRKANLRVAEFVDLLEEVMIRTAARWSVAAGKDPRNRGAWVGNGKLGSVGLAVHRGVTWHGIAFNVNPDLEPFSWIDPCGLTGVKMTSIAAESETHVTVREVLPVMKENVEDLFGVRLESTTIEEMEVKNPDPEEPALG